MKFSIIIPIYNAEGCIERCLDSIKAQIYKDFECLLIDDGSKDSSGAICDAYAASDARFISIHQCNSGVSEARNMGLSRARGEWVTFVDADDSITPDYLQEIDCMTAGSDLIMWGYNTNKVNVCKHVKGSIDEALFAIGSHLSFLKPVWSKACRMSIIRQSDLKFAKGLHMGEDYLFVLDYLCRISKSVCIIDKPLYNYDTSLSVLSRKHYPAKDILYGIDRQIRCLKQLQISNHNRYILMHDRRKAAFVELYLSDNLEERSIRYTVLKYLNTECPYPPVQFYLLEDAKGVFLNILKKVKNQFCRLV